MGSDARRGVDSIRHVVAEPVPHRQPCWIIVGDPDSTVCIFPTSALRGRSMPMVCPACMSRVPAAGSPKISSSVGRSGMPTAAAAAPWSIRAKTAMPLFFSMTSKRSMVTLTELPL